MHLRPLQQAVLDQLDQVSEGVGFHIPRPEERAIGAGNLRIRTGSATYEDFPT